MKQAIFAFLMLWMLPASAEEKIYELEYETDSNWASIEIRDDAVFVNAPADSTMSITEND